MNTLKIDSELKSMIPPLTKAEFDTLEKNIQQEGCRESLIVWDGIIIDGHNRYDICKKNNIEFNISEKHFESKDAAKIWMIDNQKGRRNLTDGWKWELAQAKKELLKNKGKEKQIATLKKGDAPPVLSTFDKTENHDTRKEIANELGWSTGKTAMADKVWKEAEPETKEKIKSGDVTFNQAYSKIRQKEKQQKIEKENQEREVKEPKYKAKIYHQSASEFLNRFESRSVDLLLTDPPYSTDIENMSEFLGGWLYDALDKVKDTGRAYICIGAYPAEVKTYIDMLQKTDWIIDCPLIWTYKNTLGQTPKMKYNLNYQMILHLYKETSTPLNNNITNEMFSVQEINAPDGRQGDRFFKWQKPDKLASQLINHATKQEDVIIDPFTGSGSFILKAASLNRYAYGCEKNKEVLDIAIKRGCYEL